MTGYSAARIVIGLGIGMAMVSIAVVLVGGLVETFGKRINVFGRLLVLLVALGSAVYTANTVANWTCTFFGIPIEGPWHVIRR
jgi:hypothetical protein